MKTTQIGQKELKISQDVFSVLIANIECETADELETVGFKSSNGKYSLSFHGTTENGYDLSVEDFGKMEVGNWIQMEPTEGQLIAMQNTILSKVDTIYELQEMGEPEIEYQENYGLYSNSRNGY